MPPLNLKWLMTWPPGGPRFPGKWSPVPRQSAVRRVCLDSACKCITPPARKLGQAPSQRRGRRQLIEQTPSASNGICLGVPASTCGSTGRALTRSDLHFELPNRRKWKYYLQKSRLSRFEFEVPCSKFVYCLKIARLGCHSWLGVVGSTRYPSLRSS